MNDTAYPVKRSGFAALVTVVGALVLGPGAASAQESLPRLTFGGTGLVSFNLDARTGFAGGANGDTEIGTVNDFSDSFVLVRLDRQLFEKDRAGAVIGLLFPDSEADLGQVYYNQVNVFYDSRRFGGVMGRTRLSNALLEFPVVREEDLIEYGFVTSGFSNAENSEFSRYGNVLRGEFFQMDGRLVLAAQASNWTVTDAEGERVDDFDVNALSGAVVYRLPDGIRYHGTVRRAGLEVVLQNVDTPEREWMAAVLGGLALNLTRDPLSNWELRVQGIYNFGLDAEAGGFRFSNGEDGTVPLTLGDPAGRARSESVALAASLRFLSRPYQLQRFQAAVTGAYKTFPGRDASQFTVVPNVLFRLGQGMDVGLQYRFEQYDDLLAAQLGRKRDHSVQLVVGFRWQMMFNDYFGERDDILNLEHGYIP